MINILHIYNMSWCSNPALEFLNEGINLYMYVVY